MAKPRKILQEAYEDEGKDSSDVDYEEWKKTQPKYAGEPEYNRLANMERTVRAGFGTGSAVVGEAEPEENVAEGPSAPPFSTPRDPSKRPWKLNAVDIAISPLSSLTKLDLKKKFSSAYQSEDNTTRALRGDLGKPAWHDDSGSEPSVGHERISPGIHHEVAWKDALNAPENKKQAQALGAISRTKFSGVPDDLKPSVGFGDPNYPSKLREALSIGLINEAQYNSLWSEYKKFSNTSMGKNLEAARMEGHYVGMQLKEQDEEAKSEEQRLHDEASLYEDYDDRLDRLSAQKEAATRERSKSIEEQINNVRESISDLKSLKPGEFGGAALAMMVLGGILGGGFKGMASSIGMAVNAKMNEYQLEINKGSTIIGKQENLLEMMRERIGDDNLAFEATKIAILEDLERHLHIRSLGNMSESVRRKAQAAREQTVQQVKIAQTKMHAQFLEIAEGKARQAALSAGWAKAQQARSKRLAAQLGPGGWAEMKNLQVLTPEFATTIEHGSTESGKVREKLAKFGEFDYHLREMARLAQDPDVSTPGTKAHVDYLHHHASYTGVRIHDLIGGQQAAHEYDRIQMGFPADARVWKDIQKSGNLPETINNSMRSQTTLKNLFMQQHGLVRYKPVYEPDKDGRITQRNFVRAEDLNTGSSPGTDRIEFSAD